ncbi:hypothetical protein BJ742DRAFT_835700, partial [Cladochytrium replicatum]
MIVSKPALLAAITLIASLSTSLTPLTSALVVKPRDEPSPTSTIDPSPNFNASALPSNTTIVSNITNSTFPTVANTTNATTTLHPLPSNSTMIHSSNSTNTTTSPHFIPTCVRTGCFSGQCVDARDVKLNSVPRCSVLQLPAAQCRSSLSSCDFDPVANACKWKSSPAFRICLSSVGAS